MSRKVGMISLGCPKNQVDAEVMLKKLEKISTDKNIVMTASIAVEECPDAIKAYA